MISRYILVLLGILLLFLAACGQGLDLDQPPEIRYGEDICDSCNMIISEARYAAAYYTEGGEVRRFDDIGDMCRFHIEKSEKVARFWVHDFDTEGWLQAENAIFVLGGDLYTPMGSGIVAFADRQRAGTFAGENQGLVMSFAELIDHYRQDGGGDPHQSMDK